MACFGSTSNPERAGSKLHKTIHSVWRKSPLKLMIAFIVALGCTSMANSAERPPNILIIMADDQGWGDLSLHGNKNIQTPHIDALAHSGARFDRFYVSSVCAPTRASLLTGRYSNRTGVHGVSRGQERLNLDEVTIAELFQSAGYATGGFGKWHNGSQYPYHPNGRGFEEFYGFCCGHWSNYFNTLLEHNGEEVRGEGYVNDDFTNHALKFIETNQAKPFLCYLTFNTPHTPFQMPDEYFDRVKQRGLSMFHRDREREKPLETISALAMCENIDWNVGRLLKTLDELGLAEETIVIYLSDNGPNTWRWNAGMKGKKGSVDEGGLRSPFIIRWPGTIPAGRTIDRIAAHIDVLPTLVDLAGLDISRAPRQPKPLDGISLRPLLTGDSENWPDRMLFSSFRDRSSLRTQRYYADANSLFDLQADPGQRTNLAQAQADLHSQLSKALHEWQRDAVPNSHPSRPYPVGAGPNPLTVLPAQESVFHGKGLRFSAPPPNASWLTGWTDRDAYPTWDIEVHTPGRYEAILKYTCGEDAVGTELTLSVGDRSVTGRVTIAYDPPLLDSPDRVERKESYEKPFRRMKLGEIKLTQGRGLLTLKATSKPGGEVIDLRAIELKRR